MNEAAPSPPPAPLKYGTFNARLMASSIELGILAILTTPLIEWLTERLIDPSSLDPLNELLHSLAVPDPGSGDPNARMWQAVLLVLYKIVTNEQIMGRLIFGYALNIVFIALYTLPFWFYYSSTPGKMLFGLTIRDAMTTAPMTRRQAVIRFLGYIVSFIPFTFGFVWIVFNKKRQGWHDVMANTVVIKKPK